MSQIKCNVKNCKYWGQGNLCTAEKIQVSNVDYSSNMEAGSFERPAPCSNSYQTQCVSFVPKEK